MKPIKNYLYFKIKFVTFFSLKVYWIKDDLIISLSFCCKSNLDRIGSFNYHKKYVKNSLKPVQHGSCITKKIIRYKIFSGLFVMPEKYFPELYFVNSQSDILVFPTYSYLPISITYLFLKYFIQIFSTFSFSLGSNWDGYSILFTLKWKVSGTKFSVSKLLFYEFTFFSNSFDF